MKQGPLHHTTRTPTTLSRGWGWCWVSNATPKAKRQLQDTRFAQAEAAKGDRLGDSTHWIIPFSLQRDTSVDPHVYVYLSAGSLVPRAI